MCWARGDRFEGFGEGIPLETSAAGWDALRNDRPAISRCDDCRTWQHPPQERCRHCGGPASFEDVSGRGTIFSFIVVRQQMVPGHDVPYVVGLVELEEQRGLRLSARVAATPEDVTIGAPVRVRFADIGNSGFRAPELELSEL